MLDLETLGNGSNAVIISIGAVRFDVKQKTIINKFYARICPKSCTDAGLVIDAETVLWWMKQSDAARGEFANANLPKLPEVLASFSHWVKAMPGEPRIWGNGATFDNVILSNAYKAIKMDRPWSHRSDRCYRTIKALFPDIKVPDVSTAHNAVDDAEYQARHLMAIWPHLRGANAV